MDLNDVSAANFFRKVTYSSDINAGQKLKIPDGEFVLCAILLKLDLTLNKLKSKING